MAFLPKSLILNLLSQVKNTIRLNFADQEVGGSTPGEGIIYLLLGFSSAWRIRNIREVCHPAMDR